MSHRMLSVLALIVTLTLTTFLTPAAAYAPPTPTAPTGDILQQEEPDEEAVPPENGSTGAEAVFDGLGVLFGILGVYIVTMFTMAIGTEILVDILKGILGKPLGLRSRPNTREKLNEFSQFLPGQLENLGVSAEAKQRLERQVRDLANILEPAFTAETAVAHFKAQRITAALNTIGVDWTADNAIDQVKMVVQKQIEESIERIDTSTTIGLTVQRTLEKSDILKKADRAIERTAKRLSDRLTPDEIYRAVSYVASEEIANGVTAWTRAYFNSLQEKSYEAARSTYENQLHPQLVAFNLGPTLQGKVESEFETFLYNLKTYRATDVYLDSLNNFLQELEYQRNIVRSWLGQLIDTFIEGAKRLLRRSPLQHPMLAPQEYDPKIYDSTQVANKLLGLEQYDKEQDKKRVRRIRMLSVFLGTILAYLMQIDSADLLRQLFPPDSAFLDLTLIRGESFLLAWIPGLLGTADYDLTAGVLLTGLAASAGSTFWHEQLSRLQATKQNVDRVEAALQPIIVQQATARRETDE